MPSSSYKTTSSSDLKSPYHYIALSALPANPSTTNELSLRKFIQNALTQAFGNVFANTYLDILSFQYPRQRVVRQSLRNTNIESDAAAAAAAADGDEDGEDVVKVVIRVASEDALKFKAAIAAAAAPSTPGALHVSVINDSSFLPALLGARAR